MLLTDYLLHWLDKGVASSPVPSYSVAGSVLAGVRVQVAAVSPSLELLCTGTVHTTSRLEFAEKARPLGYLSLLL